MTKLIYSWFITILVFLLFIFWCNPIPASEQYITYSQGVSTLNYDLKGEASEAILQNDKEIIIGDINVNAHLTSEFSKIAYGYKISDHFYIGIMHFKIGEFKLDADIYINKEISNKYIRMGFKGSGVFNSSASLSGIGPKLESFFPIIKNTGVIFGIGVTRSKAIIKTSYQIDTEYSYSYNYISPDEFPNLSGGKIKSEHREKNTYEVIKFLMPVFSVGFIHKLTEKIFLRSEFERYGHPTNQNSIDVFSTGLQVNF